MKPKPGFPTVLTHSTPDRGKEGYRGCSPWARQGIFIFSETRKGQPDSTPDLLPGYHPGRRPAVENKGMKTFHEFEGAGTHICIYCVMMREGHDKLMEKLKKAS
jgi:hypothetical protein